MSLNGIGALCKCGGRSRIRSLTGEPRHLLRSRERSPSGGVQVESRRNMMILNPRGPNIRGQNLSAPPPIKQIPTEEDKVAQVMKIIQNLELKKGHIAVNPELQTNSKEAINAIVETARTQDADVSKIVEASAKDFNAKLSGKEDVLATTNQDETESVEEKKSESSQEISSEKSSGTAEASFPKELPDAVSITAKSTTSNFEKSVENQAEHPTPKLIQSKNKKFSMSITSAEQSEPDMETDSSSSDSDSDSSSSSSDSDGATATSQSALGKTKLNKMSAAELSILSSYHYRMGRMQYYNEYQHKPKNV
jgi:hypothetical protein